MAKRPRVRKGCRVTIQHEDTQEISTYSIVSPDVADPSQGKISVHCPLAQSIIGCCEGESVSVHLPDGPQAYKIRKISDA